jgi:hypothetical protein
VEQTWVPQNIANLAQRRRNVNGIYEPRRTLSKDHLVHNVPHVKDRTFSNASSNLHISWSDSATTMTDVEESRVSSIVSVKRIRRASIAEMNNIEKPGEVKNVDIKLENYRDNKGNDSAIRRSAVTVVRVTRVSIMDETDKSNSNTSREETSSATSTISKKTPQVNVTRISRSETDKSMPNTSQQKTPSAKSTISKKTSEVKVTKISRNKTATTQRRRSSSVGNLSIIHLDRSSIEMQLMANRLKTPMFSTNSKANKGNGVTVIKLPRKLTASQSFFS